ncbi:MAG: hypothetical protein QM770_01110 [Tepidisphaeraceae bacterium]
MRTDAGGGYAVYQQQLPQIIPLFDRYCDIWSYWLRAPKAKFKGHSTLFDSSSKPTALLPLYQQALIK